MNRETKSSPVVPEQPWTKASEAADDCWVTTNSVRGDQAGVRQAFIGIIAPSFLPEGSDSSKFLFQEWGGVGFKTGFFPLAVLELCV